MWLLLLMLLVFACGKPEGQEKVEGKKLETAKVKELFRVRGCTDCHDKRVSLIGPPFLEIAKRYKGQRDAEKALLKSLKEGSCGKWKARWECMPPQKLEEAEAKAMVSWILSLISEAESSQ